MASEERIKEGELTVYYADKSNEKINFLGENGWFIFSESPTIIAHSFTMRDGEHLNNLKKWLEDRANANNDEREFIKKSGFPVTKIKSDGFKGWKYVIKDYSALFDWRIEFDYNEDKPVVYITFGPKRMASPAIASKKVIDEFVPEEIMKVALDNGSIYEAKAEEEGGADA